MKKILLVFLCLILLTGCNEKEQEEQKKNNTTITNVTCNEMISLVQEGATLIDVRTSEEFNQGHLENAINLNSETIKYVIKKYVSDTSSPVVLYCASGNRSKESANELINLGYTKVYDMGAISNCMGEE